MDAAFAELESRFGAKVNFVRLDWGSDEADDAVKEFSLTEPPASVIADAKGRVVQKFEGVRSARSMAAKLESLLAAKN